MENGNTYGPEGNYEDIMHGDGFENHLQRSSISSKRANLEIFTYHERPDTESASSCTGFWVLRKTMKAETQGYEIYKERARARIRLRFL